MTDQPLPTPEEKIELAIEEALKGRFGSDWFIAVFPDDPDAFDMSIHPKVALIQYVGSRYSTPEGFAGGAQMRQREFAVHITLNGPKIKGPVRGSRAIEEVRHALQGRRVEGGDLRLVRDGLADQTAGVWQYLVTLAIDTRATPLPRTTPAPIMSRFDASEGAD